MFIFSFPHVTSQTQLQSQLCSFAAEAFSNLIFYLISTDESKKQIRSLVSCTSKTGETPFLFLDSSGLITREPFIPKWILEQNQTHLWAAESILCITFLFFIYWNISKQIPVTINTQGHKMIANITYFFLSMVLHPYKTRYGNHFFNPQIK